MGACESRGWQSAQDCVGLPHQGLGCGSVLPCEALELGAGGRRIQPGLQSRIAPPVLGCFGPGSLNRGTLGRSILDRAIESLQCHAQ
ncbi:hypothetical protein UW163_22685 (plasmid) [Ralstonia solanacearum]|nr:hypothetical protein UW163_22685 [Ralstonia solanacearum]EUJ13153.1 hypothetical protein RSP673_17445 [Ralstonia solanacearum P673]OAI69078.1 hypothetical protein RSP797_17535 [Ralstonia solanacearum]